MPTPLPGFESPAVGFEQPFDMLEACHERVERTLALLGRLIDHVAAHGHDERSRSAASDVLRYFDLAAPLHHEDEERHVFPPLLASGDAQIAATVAALRQDHVRMGELWARLRAELLRWRDDPQAGPPTRPLRDDADAFIRLYSPHIEREESLVFPRARALCETAALEAMSRDMQARRRGG